MNEKNTEKREQLKIFSENELKAIEKQTSTEVLETLEDQKDWVQLKIEFSD